MPSNQPATATFGGATHWRSLVRDVDAQWAACPDVPTSRVLARIGLGAGPAVTSVCWTARQLGWDGAWLVRDRDAHDQHTVVISGVQVFGVHRLTED
jgi:hypothetical protein